MLLTLRNSTPSAARTFALLSLLTTFNLTHAVSPADVAELVLQKRDLTYVGCYSSATPLQEANTWKYQSQGYCQTHCAGGAIGLTNGDTCFCGHAIPATSNKVDDSKCDIECSGWGQSMCGGNGFWSVWLTGNEVNVPTYSGGSSSSSSSGNTGLFESASSSNQVKGNPATTPTAVATVVTSQIAGGSTVIITVPATPDATASAQSSNGGGGGSGKTAGIAAGVVVGVVVLFSMVAGVYFFLRRRQRKKAEEDYRHRSQVSDFMRSASEHKAPGTGYSSMSDSRLDPEAGRRNSAGSLADNQDYSRRILRVANPDSS